MLMSVYEEHKNLRATHEVDLFDVSDKAASFIANGISSWRLLRTFCVFRVSAIINADDCRSIAHGPRNKLTRARYESYDRKLACSDVNILSLCRIYGMFRRRERNPRESD